MGLDYSINLELTNVKSKKKCLSIEIAYWRKAWGLANLLQEIAAKPKYMICRDDDYKTECHSDVLNEIVNIFTEAIKEEVGGIWSNSLFGSEITRFQTIQNLAHIRLAQDWLKYPADLEIMDLIAYDSRDTSVDEEAFKDFLDNPQNYEMRVVFYNSY